MAFALTMCSAATQKRLLSDSQSPRSAHELRARGPGVFFRRGRAAAAARARAREPRAPREKSPRVGRATSDVRREGEPGRYIVKAVLRCKICKYKILALICHFDVRAPRARGGPAPRLSFIFTFSFISAVGVSSLFSLLVISRSSL
jgi:hypothetical protein